MYLIIKSLHIISVITWMAGLLYLPRLFVYHSLSEINSIQSETFKIMERKVIKSNNATINNICIWFRFINDILKLLSDFRTLFPNKSDSCINDGIHPWKIFKNV